MGLGNEALAFEYLFSRPIPLAFAVEKLSRNSGGGGEGMTISEGTR